ncbi:MAG TPA: hypothetical protein VIF62_08150 [Labilithrix sp.]
MDRLIARAAAALACVWACSDSPAPKGELVLEIQTDVALPDSVDRVRIEVLARGALVFGNEYDVGPATLHIPGTLGLLEGADASTPFLVRVIAKKGSSVKMLREVTTTIPGDRVATLRVPIRWLCDDSGKETSPDQYENATCPAGQTCIGGDCHESSFDSSTAPSESAPGACFDVVACMRDGTAVDVEPTSCTFAKPAIDPAKLNVALRVQNDGICDPSGALCFVVLDRALVDGWQDLGERIQLPHAVCTRLASGRVQAVVASSTCDSKTDAQDVCGCWSNAGCPPAGPPVDAGVDATVDAGAPNTTTPTAGPLGDARSAAGGATLRDGTVLVAGGWNAMQGSLLTAEIYDPVSRTFSSTGPMSSLHLWSAWFTGWPVLADGRVLVAGGLTSTGMSSVAEIFDPATKTFTPTGPLPAPVLSEDAVVLADGSALYVGGYDDAITNSATLPAWQYFGNGTTNVARFDPGAGTFTATGPLSQAMHFACVVALPSGHAVVLGGHQYEGALELDVDDYDPVTKAFAVVGALPAGTDCNFAVLLPSGKILATGSDGSGTIAYLFDPTTKAIAKTNGFPTTWTPKLILLANGDALGAGGRLGNVPTSKMMRYLAASNTWIDVGPLHSPRDAVAMYRLASGDVLIAGGSDDKNVPLTSAETFHP